MAFFISTRFILVKYSCAFVERPSQGTSSLASRLTTTSLDIYIYIYIYSNDQNYLTISNTVIISNVYGKPISHINNNSYHNAITTELRICMLFHNCSQVLMYLLLV